MKKSRTSKLLPLFLLDACQEENIRDRHVVFSEALSEAVLADIAQKCMEQVLLYLEREAKFQGTSFTHYFMQKMGGNRLLKAMGSDLAQLAILELAKCHEKPQKESCLRSSTEAAHAGELFNGKSP